MKTTHALILASLACSQAHAGEPAFVPQPSPEKNWEYLLAVYMPLMGIEGDVGIGPAAGSIDVPFDDILSNLDGGAMIAFEARREKWSITADFIWLKISGSTDLPAEASLDLRQEEILATLAVGYELYGNERTTLDALAGAALTNLDLDVTLKTPLLPVTERQESGSRTWIDPYIGLRLRHRLSDRWAVFATGIYGGFGVSSEEYWQAVAGVSYRVHENVSLALAYRMIGTDYDRGGFVYDVEMSGPNVGLVFRF